MNDACVIYNPDPYRYLLYAQNSADSCPILIGYTHQPDIFPNPERFDPDRFTPDAEAHRPRYAYLPFGAGGRSCLGQHFALVEAHILLATLTQQVVFELVPGQRIVPEPLITLRPRGGIRMIVRRREQTHMV